jgi:hypothetical protein
MRRRMLNNVDEWQVHRDMKFLATTIVSGSLTASLPSRADQTNVAPADVRMVAPTLIEWQKVKRFARAESRVAKWGFYDVCSSLLYRLGAFPKNISFADMFYSPI